MFIQKDRTKPLPPTTGQLGWSLSRTCWSHKTHQSQNSSKSPPQKQKIPYKHPLIQPNKIFSRTTVGDVLNVDFLAAIYELSGS